MKQYTTPEQTAKLIELGFEKPRYECLDTTLRGVEKWNNIQSRYSIGELIEMLPKDFDGELLEIASVTLSCAKWMVRYPYGIIVYKNELVDALYEMIIKLKEDEII